MRPLLVALLLLTAASVQAQDAGADPADVESIDAILSAIYDVISGPYDADRDWDRFRSLHHPQARLIPTSGQGGTWAPIVLTPDEFAERSGDVMRNAPIFQGKGFYETEAERRVERYDHIAQVWSTYESRLDPEEEPFARGINTFQLFWDGERWWILNVLWQQEDEGSPIPSPYLPDAG